jgi:ATP-dependent helicase/nuclease subunit B
MNPEILQALDQGDCVITATSRLSYELGAAYERYQIKRDKKVWPTASIFTWDAWIQDLWFNASACSSQLNLSNAQLQQLLSNIIEADLKTHDTQTEHGLAALWNIPATARTVLDAWQLCHQWRVSYTALQSSEQTDHARFGHWAATLYARLRAQNWISTAQLPDILIEAGFKATQDAVFFGFDHLNTQQENFIEYYRGHGAQLKLINSENIVARKINRYCFDSTAAEWRQIGAWARNKLLDNPDLKIGIITPDTGSIRAVAENSLREQLTPAYFQRSGRDPFHFSVGGTLADQPLVKSALASLGLLGDLEFKQLSAVFLSNHWCSNSEQQLRAKLLIHLRRKIAYRFDLYEFIASLSATQNGFNRVFDAEQSRLEKFLDKLQALQTIKSKNRGVRPLSNWRDLFTSCLLTLGWPIAKLDSDEFQALQSWEHCLDEWIKLDAVCEPMSLMQALQSLNSFCRETVFQAQAQARAPVQIMGILEAAELDFDYAWLAGFDEQAWPVLATPNPFIPINIQIEAGIPAAQLTLQAELAESRTEQLCALCSEIVYSYAYIQEDVELGVSTIFPQPSNTEQGLLPTVFSLDEAIRGVTPPLESRSDDVGFPYREARTRGGAGLIQKQSACPFSAYARYRLKADEDDEPQPGMDSLARGSLLHKILETIWQELKDSNALHRQIEQGTLGELIQRNIEQQLKRFSACSGLGEGFDQAETRRLNSLITEWLKLEATRPPFKVIATELELEYPVNGLTLNLSLDRVDQLTILEGGASVKSSQLILDYKSGQCQLKDWEGPRPNQPQMPLYFLALENSESQARGNVDALSFAQVKAGQCQFTGISRLENTLPDVHSLETLSGSTSLKKDIDEWALLSPLWSERIEKLIEDYQRGFAHVDPKSIQSCTFCNFGPLCRIHTRNRQRREELND